MFSPQQVELTPSRRLGAVFFGLALMTAYSLWLVMMPWFVYVLLYPVLFVLLNRWRRRYVSLEKENSVLRLRWQAKERTLDLRLQSGQWLNVTEIEQRVIWPWLTGLRVRVEHPEIQVLNILVLPDSVASRGQYRQFRVMCRFARVRNTQAETGIL
ncbi:protein YgfX [Aliamphritea ceti]|uniref:protein YgfX n=1 Tax=Aliamphritea ceti TaxID=1524258 RepID=UPI00301500B1